MLKNWPTPLLDPRAHYSCGRLSVKMGCFALSVFWIRSGDPFWPTMLQPVFSIQKFFISVLIPYESSSHVHIDKFGLLNRLISISEAQDIPIWISKRESREFCREQDSDPSFALKTLLPSQFCWSLFLGYTLSHIGMLGICQFLNQIRRPFFTNQIAARFCYVKRFISPQILHESCSPTCVDEFGFLSCLISIS